MLPSGVKNKLALFGISTIARSSLSRLRESREMEDDSRRRAIRQPEIYRKNTKKRVGLFFPCFNRFLDKSKINYMYMYFRPARSRSLFILASTLGDIRERGVEVMNVSEG